MRIALDQFPIAPSVNNLFPSVRVRGNLRRVKSGEYKTYERLVTMWAIERHSLLEQTRESLQPYLNPGWWIQTNLFFCMPESKIFTKSAKAKSALQKWDACNRIKATHDSLSTLLGIDDRHFSVGIAEKVQTGDQISDPYTLIVLQPVRMVTEKNVIEEVRGWVKSTERGILKLTGCDTLS